MAKHRGTAGNFLFLKTILATLFGTKRQRRAYARGLAGEQAIGRALARLPEGWRVWHDLDIGGENVDHVVASYKGVFIIEVKNYRGRVLALPSGLYTHGNKRPNSKVTAQVWRQVRALNEHLDGQHIRPVLVFLNGVQAGKETTGIPHSRKIPCLSVEQLVPYLKDQPNALPYEVARNLFGTLDNLTK